jgi:hypothetical protein
MRTSRVVLPTLLACLLGAAAPAAAHHISGKVYCDKNWDGKIDSGDIKLSGITVKATSLDVSPGSMWTDATDTYGYYYIALPARTDRYRVELTGLPAGWTVVVPLGGQYVFQIITQSIYDHKDNVKFLIQGCSTPPSTTTTTTKPSTTTTTTKSSTTTTKPSTTTTTSPTTTTTTLPQKCDCNNFPFLVRTSGKFNNEADIRSSIGVNDVGGKLQFGKQVLLADGTVVAADQIKIGGGTSLYSVLYNTLFLSKDALIRDGTGVVQLPLIDPFCTVPDIVCGDTRVNLPPKSTMTLTPGVYGKVRVANGATLSLLPGHYVFCEVKTGRGATIEALGAVSLDVAGNLTIGTASKLVRVPNAPLIVAQVAGKRVKFAHDALVEAIVTAPIARIQFGRESYFFGCFCTDRASTDKHITLECVDP